MAACDVISYGQDHHLKFYKTIRSSCLSTCRQLQKVKKLDINLTATVPSLDDKI